MILLLKLENRYQTQKSTNPKDTNMPTILDLIQSCMPKPKPLRTDFVSGGMDFGAMENGGYNQALSEITQILKDIDVGELLDRDKIKSVILDTWRDSSMDNANNTATALTKADIYKKLGE